jgi:DNA-binding NtrC family response regulator
MQLRSQMEALIKEMLDGQILLSEAVSEFEKVYIESAMARHGDHLCNTAAALGIHRNTLSKRVAEYNATPKPKKREHPSRPKSPRSNNGDKNLKVRRKAAR